jgi:hypothetical protein
METPTLTTANLSDGSWKEKLTQYPPEMKFGWIQWVHLALDPYCEGRLSYMLDTIAVNDLLADDIPLINWTNKPNPKTAQHLKDCISAIANQPYETLEGEEIAGCAEYLFNWLLWGWGNSNYIRMPPPKSSDGRFWRLLDTFDLGLFLAHPHDYFGDLFIEIGIYRELDLLNSVMGKYYIAQLECAYPSPPDSDIRARVVATDHVHTGRIPLLLSNYTLRVIADFEATPSLCIKAAMVNFNMYAPWVNRGFEGIENNYDAMGVYHGNSEDDDELELEIPQIDQPALEIPTLQPEDQPFEFSIELAEEIPPPIDEPLLMSIDFELLPEDKDRPALESA